MFRIRMDTDEVRMMAARLRGNADVMEARVTGLNSMLQNANWQSNAREEFINDFLIIEKSSLTLAEVMRLMANAAERKADQWESIGNIFLGPFYALGGIWSSVMDRLGSAWERVNGILKGIKWPSKGAILPVIGIGAILPGLGGASIMPILGPIARIMPFPDPTRLPWLKEKPSWWPRIGEPGDARTLPIDLIKPDDRQMPVRLPGEVVDADIPDNWDLRLAEETNLRTEINDLQAHLTVEPNNEALKQQLSQMQVKYNKLNNSINEGINTSITPDQQKNVLGGCTNYVASKRDVSGFYKPGHMNATYWNENAAAAGFEVGSRPVKGSIMVLEADGGVNNGIMNVHDTAGHVAYVENVTDVNGGYMVSISHGGTKYRDDGSYIPGTYKELKPITVFVPYESNDVNFIYEKA